MQPKGFGKQLGAPYCDHCGYSFVGLTESSRCPECGKPIVEVLMRDPLQGGRSKRYQSKRKLWGLPLVSIAYGPAGGEPYGKPVGIVAIGEFPRGVIAIGSMSLGVVAIGGGAAGVIAIGGVGIGLLAGVGGVATGFFAVGGLAIGGYAVGGCCLYLIKAVGGRMIPLLR